jgi:hypothetical protein
MQGCLRAECSNPSIERTFQRPLRALGPPLMSNLRRHSWAVDRQADNEGGELGLNLALPEAYREPTGWYQDVEAILVFCAQLRRELRRDIVIAVADQLGLSEDIIEVESDSPNAEYVKKFIGVEPPRQS